MKARGIYRSTSFNNILKCICCLVATVIMICTVSLYSLKYAMHYPTSGIETELMHVVKDMPIDKQETLLRIAKAL